MHSFELINNDADSPLGDLGKIDKTPVDVFLRSGSAGGAERALDAFFSDIGEAHLESALLRLYITLDVYLAAKVFAEELGVERTAFTRRFGAADDTPQHAGTAQSAKRYLAGLLEQCVAWRHAYSHGSAFTIEKAKAYLAKNFSDESISLERVAQAVNVSPAYFSHLFKKETGVSLTAHITSLRMEKARKLLCCSSMKIAEVARESGYGDYHYFSCMFKKSTGLTPSAFRATGSKTQFR